MPFGTFVAKANYSGRKMPKARDLKKNQLLAALPEPEWKRWSAALERIEMPLGAVLYEPGIALKDRKSVV